MNKLVTGVISTTGKGTGFVALENQDDRDQDILIEPVYTSEETREILTSDKLFSEIVVQRSRSYVKKSVEQEIQKGGQKKAVVFPERSEPQVVKYSLEKVYGTKVYNFEADKKRWVNEYLEDSSYFCIDLFYLSEQNY